MEISLKNILLAGIGTAAYTYEKGSDIIETLVKKGELTINQGKELNEELKKVINKKTASEPASQSTADALKEAVSDLNTAIKQDLEELKLRVSKLEGKKDTL